jgi:hypothetical protein
MYFDRTSPFSEILPNTNCEVDMAYNGQKKKKNLEKAIFALFVQ